MKKLFIILGLSAGLILPVGMKALDQDWFQTGQSADIILGPYVNSGGPSVLHHPARVCADTSGRLFVADTRNNRILIWNTFPTYDKQPADVILGCTNLTARIYRDRDRAQISN